MRISDWSSDVCSSDLRLKNQLRILLARLRQHMNATRAFFLVGGPGSEFFSKRLDQIPRHGNFRNGPLHVPPSRATARCLVAKHERPVQRTRDPDVRRPTLPLPLLRPAIEIGRASVRERVCKYGSI